MEKNLNLLRPFDMKAAEAGARLCWFSNADLLLAYIGKSGSKCCVRFLTGTEKGDYSIVAPQFLGMAPLTWVEGRPVYLGDGLYLDKSTGDPGAKFTVGCRLLDEDIIEGVSVFPDGKVYDQLGTGMMWEDLTWTAPVQEQPATQTLKLLAFLDDQGALRWVQEGRYITMYRRVPSEDKVIEIS